MCFFCRRPAHPEEPTQVLSELCFEDAEGAGALETQCEKHHVLKLARLEKNNPMSDPSYFGRRIAPRKLLR